MTKKQILVFCTAAVIIVAAVMLSQVVINTAVMKSDIASRVLRLHIIAEDNEPKNQLLKLCVRDRIIRDFSDIFGGCQNIGECERAAADNLDKIKAAAEDELIKMGNPSAVQAYIGRSEFPTKEYGKIALPRGEYTALKIEIGKGGGRNWWCVMYPPLCITEGNAVISPESAQKLKETLSDDEYRLICDSKSPNIKIKFRIAEILGKYF